MDAGTPVSQAGAARQYVCPGETQPISHSVHLARLAAFYPNCRECPLRHETGHLAARTLERLESTRQRIQRASLLTDEGIRAVYVNELDRARAGRIAARLAEWLWERSPHTALLGGSRSRLERPGPTVVVGHDERSSSPDVLTGIVSALRRMGCRVVDVHRVSRPGFWFAVTHLKASAGLYVTGSGSPPAWTGIDVVGDGGVPVSAGPLLSRLETETETVPARPTRHGGGYRTFSAKVPYEAGLWKHFHALRPLRVCAASASGLVADTLRALFERLPCTLLPVSVPQRVRELDDPEDADVQRVSAAIEQANAHAGILIDDDGQRVALLDERGELVPTADVAALLAEVELAEQGPGVVAVRKRVLDAWRPRLAPLQATVVDGGDSFESLARTMRGHEARCGLRDDGRYWFAEPVPTCDAILTLGRVLAGLSRSDAPFSEAAAG